MSGEIQKMALKCASLKGEREAYQKELESLSHQIDNLHIRVGCIEEARTLIQTVASEIQKGLQSHLSNLVTTALQSVFQDEIEFVPEIIARRGKTECDLYFKKGYDLYNPIDSNGGGTIDVASFALRLCYWALKPNRSTFILDEPFKFVSHDLQEKVSTLLKMLSTDLGVQFIIVSHQEDINMSADKTFLVTKNGQMSIVEEV